MEDKADKLMREAIEGELVGTGQFLTDKMHMSRKVSAEIEKVYNEKILPYKLYAKSSSKTFCGVAFIHFLIFAFFYFGPLKFKILDLLSFIGVLVALEGGTSIKILISLPHQGYLLTSSLLKLYRAEKLFKQVRQELHSETVEGKVDISDLITEFDKKEQEIRERVKAIEKQKEKERQDKKDEIERLRQKEKSLIEKAKNTDI